MWQFFSVSQFKSNKLEKKMKTVLVLLALVASSLGMKLQDSSESEEVQMPVKVEQNLEVFVNRLAEWNEYWKDLSDTDRDMLMKIIDERIALVKKDAEPKPMEQEKVVEVSDLPDLPATPYLPSLLRIRDSADIPQEDMKKIDEFLTVREEWNEKWNRMSSEHKEHLTKFIKERLDEVMGNFNREGRMHRYHHRREMDPEVREHKDKLMDFIRERVSQKDTDFPNAADKEKIESMINEFPKHAQHHIRRSFDRMHRKFEKMPEDKQEEAKKNMYKHIMEMPDKETREKHREEMKAVFKKMSEYVKSRVAETDSKFPETKDFDKAEELTKELPEHVREKFMKRLQKMKGKFEKMSDEKKEKFRKEIAKKIEKMEKNPKWAMYAADESDEDDIDILAVFDSLMDDSEEDSDESSSSED